MVEEETNKGTEKPADNAGERDKPEESKEVAKLRKKNEGMEKQLAKSEELLTKQKDMEAREALGGGSEAGKQVEKKKETPQEYVKRQFPGL